MSGRVIAYFIKNIEPAHAPTFSQPSRSNGDSKAKAPKKPPTPPKKKTDNK